MRKGFQTRNWAQMPKNASFWKGCQGVCMVFPWHYCYLVFFWVEFQLYIVPPFQRSSGFTWKDLDGNFSETLSWLVEYQARHKRRISWFVQWFLVVGWHGLFRCLWKILVRCHNFMFVGFLQLPVESICHLHPLTVHIRYMSFLCFRVQNVTFGLQSAHKLDKSMK